MKNEYDYDFDFTINLSLVANWLIVRKDHLKKLLLNLHIIHKIYSVHQYNKELLSKSKKSK